MTDWIFGIFAALCAILGLLLSSRAIDSGMYTFGLAFFAFGCFFVFFLMKQHYDAKDARRAMAKHR